MRARKQSPCRCCAATRNRSGSRAKASVCGAEGTRSRGRGVKVTVSVWLGANPAGHHRVEEDVEESIGAGGSHRLASVGWLAPALAAAALFLFPWALRL